MPNAQSNHDVSAEGAKERATIRYVTVAGSSVRQARFDNLREFIQGLPEAVKIDARLGLEKGFWQAGKIPDSVRQARFDDLREFIQGSTILDLITYGSSFKNRQFSILSRTATYLNLWLQLKRSKFLQA